MGLRNWLFSACGTALLAGIAITATPKPATAEPEVTCWWCGWMNFSDGPWHTFFAGGEGCGFPQPQTMYSNVECSRCGGTSSCHVDDAQQGECHIPCGGALAASVSEAIEAALEREDPSILLQVLGALPDGVSTRYDPVNGRMVVFMNCNPERPASYHAVSPGLRDALATHNG